MVRIGTWNVENLFLPGGPSGPQTEEAYAAKLDALADTITSLAPDVLAVQEIGAPEALTDLVARLDGDWHVALADPDDRDIRVGYLSRLPLTEVDQVSAFPAGLRPIQVDDTDAVLSAMGRPALQVRVDVSGRSLELLTCHLKSKLPGYPNGRFSTNSEGERARYAVFALNRRAAEAATVRDRATALLDDQGQQRALVVLGDLNDEAAAATTQILLGPPGSEIGTGGFDPPDQGDGQRLWNLAPLIPAEQRFTRIYRGRPELIDHILVSHAVVRVVAAGDVGTGDTDVPSITENPNARRNEPGSDHRPVFVDIRFG
ncbi:MAG: endonuclease/exonuclease/phosphatase family protein [Geodermatophilaceae bacterium]|nr:endonuclease/exonuclease/phosphatase family protein [Geodermatophilaceae bacterium]